MDEDEPRTEPPQIMRQASGSLTGDGTPPMQEESDNVMKRPSSPEEQPSPTSPAPKLPTLKKENLPPLPPLAKAAYPESSYAESSGIDDAQHLDSVTEEQQVRAQLEDVESSFVPPISFIHVAGAEGGIDDTYLFDRQSPRKDTYLESPAIPPTQTLPAYQSDAHVHENHGGSQQQSAESSTIPQPTPAVLVESERTLPKISLPEPTPGDSTPIPDADIIHTTSSLENMSSSPTAAAAARTISRAISTASNQRAERNTDDVNGTGASSSLDDSQSEVLLSGEDPFADGMPSLKHQKSESDLAKASADAGHTPGHALHNQTRPKYLRSRNASQRSSTSSFLSNDDMDSEATVGLDADYALSSGGALPAAQGLPPSLSHMLSRSISIGSMASGIDDSADSGRAMLEPLEPLEEVDRSPEMSPERKDSHELLVTPKPKEKGASLVPPTETVLARHVHNVEVPASVVKELKTKGGLITPFRKLPEYTPGPGTAAKNGRNLTLKEQSSTIERLSKENFDLKLKVMFLSDRLDKLSEEGIKEMISENVELKTSLAVIQRDNKILRRRVKELEKRLSDEQERPSTAKSSRSSDSQSSFFDPEREEELLYLREQVEEYITEIERLRSENMSNQAEKRKLAEVVRAMGERVEERVGDGLGRQEEADVFKDLLEQETARREQVDDDNRKLRDEIFRLKQELTVSSGGGSVAGSGVIHQTRNIYNISRKAQAMSPSRSRPVSEMSGGTADRAGNVSQATTLADELRKESDQLRHENAELRREVSAQTSMLTSRNREKERLYQEIEDLKLAQRRGGPAPSTIDSLLERSASRAGGAERSHSRNSGRAALPVAVEDPEREDLENKVAEYRDKINELKLQNQELQQELESCMQDFETAAEAKTQAEQAAQQVQEELDTTMNDLMAIQAERDEVLQDHANLEGEFEALRKEAQEEIDALEAEADQRTEEIQRLEADLQDRTDNFTALQEEMRQLSEALIRLEDDQETKIRRIEQLEAELGEANKEGEELEAQLLEANEKANRLGVQQESSQGEIAFLREEQEQDKIRIGDLEAALAGAEQGVRDEKERSKELDQRLGKERKQREIIATKEKQEVQQFVNELNRELTAAKDEVRRLRKALSSREVEATEWKERLVELENNLREALGDLNGTRSSLLKGIAKLQRELENTVRELDTTKAGILEKDRIIKQRDALLESSGLENKKLTDMLDKERQAHRNTKNAFETFQRTNQHVSRTLTSQDSRILELETARAQDKRKLAQLETTFKEQLTDRNKLLLILWTRLSTLCGSDWSHDNSLINGRALPSLESIATMLPAFSKNLLAAVKYIEALAARFHERARQIEKDLWKEYQILESNLDTRTKKLDRLETIVRNGIQAGDFASASRISQLEAAYRALKVENATLMRANDAKTRAVGGYFDYGGQRDDASSVADGSPSPAIPTGPTRKTSGIPRSKTTHLNATTSASSKTHTSTMTRSVSASSTELQHHSHSKPTNGSSNAGTSTDTHRTGTGLGGDDADKKWMLRLRELEHKLKQEREARNLDRAAARQRILEGERQKDELVAELVRVRRKGGSRAEGES